VDVKTGVHLLGQAHRRRSIADSQFSLVEAPFPFFTTEVPERLSPNETVDLKVEG
jgi:hypothetical protein